METLFISVQQHIATTMPQLTMVDEDWGQLQTYEDTYPVTFPCALIDLQQVEWTDASKGKQMGSATLVVKLAIDCYDDTHHTSGTSHLIMERLLMAQQLHKALHLFKGRILQSPQGNTIDNAFAPLTRTLSRFYSLPGGIKVYEMHYTTAITDCNAVPNLHMHPAPPITLRISQPSIVP